MDDVSNDWLALLALAFTMGLKHGLDADHLVAIDGLARARAAGPHPTRARWCGLSFSLGHGAVVALVAVLVGALSEFGLRAGVPASTSSWVPGWIEGLGVLISVGTLSALGLFNLRALLETPPDEHVHLVGLRAGWFLRIARSVDSVSAALLGALFALSFDTMSLASLFAIMAARFGGAARALALAAVFALGMVVVDAANGLWVARLIKRADERAVLASRWMSGTVAVLSLLVAAFGAAKYLLPDVESWSEGRELAFGLSVVSLIGLGFVLATRIPRSADAAATTPGAARG